MAEGWVGDPARPDRQRSRDAVPAHPKNNVVEWSYITVPSGITEDTWITSMQIRPSEPSVTHHICVFFKPHTPDVKYNVPYWYDRKRDESGTQWRPTPASMAAEFRIR